MSSEQICVTSGGNEGGRGGGGDQSVIVRLSYEQLNTGHKAGVSLSIGPRSRPEVSQSLVPEERSAAICREDRTITTSALL